MLHKFLNTLMNTIVTLILIWLVIMTIFGGFLSLVAIADLLMR